MHIILGIETSCDETASAVVRQDKKILSNIVFSQIDQHKLFSGVVPEIAARAHLDLIEQIIKKAMDDAGIDFNDLSAVAATCGPGLIGGVLIGATASKAIAAYHKKPFIAVNHLEGHALTARLSDEINFPYLLLLVSGGHTKILQVNGVGNYKEFGSTIDDAAGEAFDKVAKLLDIGYPGGPAVEKTAALSECMTRYELPRPMCNKPGCDFSFSGLKTAVLRKVEQIETLQKQDKIDIAICFQQAMVDILVNRCKNAIKQSQCKSLVISGGVGANKPIREALQKLATINNMRFIAPPINLCTDNAAMIAWAGLERFALDKSINDLHFLPRPRWPLYS